MFDTIGISGKSGCGNTTISTLVAKKLNYTLINYTFRQLAEKYQITFDQMLNRANNDQKYDLELDDEQKKQASAGKCVLGSRLAIWLLDTNCFRVYLQASLSKRIENIQKREQKDSHDLLLFTQNRDQSDSQRYLDLYKIDNNSYDFADCIINVDDKSINEIVDIVLTEYEKWLMSKEKPDRFGPYRDFLQKMHEQVCEKVITELGLVNKSPLICNNQMSIFEYCESKHDENYTYYLFEVEGFEYRSPTKINDYFIICLNNVFTDQLNETYILKKIINYYESIWHKYCNLRFVYKKKFQVLNTDINEVILTIHLLLDNEQYYKAIYFEKIFIPIMENLQIST